MPTTAERMQKLGKTYEPVTHAGAGHAFMRLADDANAEPANRKAHDAAWQRWKELLSAHRNGR